MMPLGDDDSKLKSSQLITPILIGINILVFFLEMAGGESFIMKWAFIPSRFLETPFKEFPTVFTSMFMHAGLAHLFGNMLYLWIFGDNVEDRLGKASYLIFYLLAGVAATFSQLFFTPESSIPNVGASGAIAGVLGAYLLLFPGEKVKVLVGNVITQFPSLIVIGLWFLLQIMGQASQSGKQDAGGVAYMAHVGGFVAGFMMAFIWVRPKISK
ncbi:MAG: rhomboid family intramembrane serine protease [Chlamydiia bacterium]|nr:rhomboid family intramembrane serine protease [Chlamydiia bacterium]